MPISNILAEIYLSNFDLALSKSNAFVSRFVDDIVVVGTKTDVLDAKKASEEAIKALNLTLSPEKTETKPCSHGFDYLGYRICFPEVSVRVTSIDKLVRSLLAIVTKHKKGRTGSLPVGAEVSAEMRREVLVCRLNERLTGAISGSRRYGWLFYFIELNRLDLLYRIDSILDDALKRIPEFHEAPPLGLKSIARAYFEIRHNIAGGYVHDYNQYTTPHQKLDFLRKFGYLEHSDESLSLGEIEQRFMEARSKQLLDLEEDTGNVS